MATRYDTSDVEIRADAVGADGILRTSARLTRTGVFPYRRADGSTVWELRHPDDVFAETHLASLRLLPVTIDHPQGGVTAENFKALAVGSTGEQVTIEQNRYLKAPVMVGDSVAVAGVQSGSRRQTSLGYTVQIREESGTYEGQRYDRRQTEMLANHLALVVRGRAGDQVGVRLDADDAILIDPPAPGDAKPAPERGPTMAKIRIDNVEHELADAGLAAIVSGKLQQLDTERARADALASKLEATAAEVATGKAKLADLEAKAAERGDAMPRADALAAARARLALEGQAVKLGVTFKADGDDGELRDALIAKLAPKLTIEGRTDEAKDAMLTVLLGTEAERADRVFQPRGGVAAPPAPGDQRADSFADAYVKAHAAANGAWQPSK